MLRDGLRYLVQQDAALAALTAPDAVRHSYAAYQTTLARRHSAFAGIGRGVDRHTQVALLQRVHGETLRADRLAREIGFRSCA